MGRLDTWVSGKHTVRLLARDERCSQISHVHSSTASPAALHNSMRGKHPLTHDGRRSIELMAVKRIVPSLSEIEERKFEWVALIHASPYQAQAFLNFLADRLAS